MAKFAPPPKRSGAREAHRLFGRRTFSAPFASEPPWAAFTPLARFDRGRGVIQRRALSGATATGATASTGARLSVSEPVDADERGAEALADRMVDAGSPSALSPPPNASPTSGVQRACAACDEDEEKEGGPASAASTVHRRADGGAASPDRGANVVGAIGDGGGGARAGADRGALASRLGEGRPLGASERRRMESVFGESFSGVRVHADSGAAGLARDLGAHAFTLGDHVAFGDGAYRPGSPLGDALLAHELAHVVQQKQAGPATVGADAAPAESSVEEDADRAAAAVVTSLYAGGSLSGVGKPRLRGGLRLSRCASNKAPAAGSPAVAPAGWDWSTFQAKIVDPSKRVDVLAAEIAALGEVDREKASKDLSSERVRLQRELDGYDDQIGNASDPAARAALVASLAAPRATAERKRQRVDEIMQIVFREVGLAEKPAASSAAVDTKTHVPDAAERAKIADALKPDPQPTPSGTPSPFKRQIAGESQKYDDKIKATVPGMVDDYWNQMVATKGPAEHSNPSKVHALTEFEPIAAAAKDATDAIFGSPSPPRPPFKADRPPAAGGRGQLHDLFADTTARLAALTPGQKREMAKQLLFYFFQSNDAIAAVNRHHSAAPAFDPATGAPSNAEARLLDGIANAFVASAAHVKKLNEIDRNWDASANPATHDVNIQIFKQATPQDDRRFLWDMYQTLIHEYIHTLAHPAFVTFADHFGPSPVKLVNTVGIHNLYAAYFRGKVDFIKP